MTWTPISLADLSKLISEAEKEMNAEITSFWNLVKINPEKWQEKSYGKEGNGFWVVGIIGKQILWYNDIEEGFNISAYLHYGEIEEYFCNQDELNISASNMFRMIKSS